jgi:hypothetical protein
MNVDYNLKLGQEEFTIEESPGHIYVSGGVGPTLYIAGQFAPSDIVAFKEYFEDRAKQPDKMIRGLVDIKCDIENPLGKSRSGPFGDFLKKVEDVDNSRSLIDRERNNFSITESPGGISLHDKKSNQKLDISGSLDHSDVNAIKKDLVY